MISGAFICVTGKRQNLFVHQAKERGGITPVVWVNLHCSVECGFDSVLEGKMKLLAEYEWVRLVSRWVSLRMIGSVRGHHHSFREEQRGRPSQGDDVTLVPGDRHRDLTSPLWLHLLCVCLEEDMLSVFMSADTVYHPVISQIPMIVSVHCKNCAFVSFNWQLPVFRFPTVKSRVCDSWHTLMSVIIHPNNHTRSQLKNYIM